MSSFAPNSRYATTETAQMRLPDGRIVNYLRRRFLPSSDRFTQVQTHSVAQGERLDHLAAVYFGDSEQFWRICDANNAMRSEDLMEIGRRLRITLPEGIAGSPYAE